MTDADETKGPQPEPQKVTCAKCGKLVDAGEVTTARGRPYCPDCVDAALAIESVLPFRGKYDKHAIKATVRGCGLLVLVVLSGLIFMLLWMYLRLNAQIECKARMGTLYEKMASYAEAHDAYLPENNDLRPLYEEKYTADFRLFVCPGTENTVTTVDHLKDDAVAPEGEGMSYFYQGGHRFAEESGDEALPLFWDQGAANHRGQGVNIIFKDGHHEWAEAPPELRPSEEAGTPPAAH